MRKKANNEVKIEVQTKYNSITQYEQFKENPFMNANSNLPIKRKDMIIGEKNHIMVNSQTGETSGHLMIAKSKEVDQEEFVKVYLTQLKLLFDLNKNAQKVVAYIMSILPPNKDRIYFDIEECKAFTNYRSVSTILDGMSELIEKEVIARSDKHYIYYTNPTIFFNGNRLTLLFEYRKKESKKTKTINKNQLALLGDSDE